MNILSQILREIAALFVDDERLAISILAVVGVCAFAAFVLHCGSLTIAALLTTGCLGVLTMSVLQGARVRRRS